MVVLTEIFALAPLAPWLVNGRTGKQRNTTGFDSCGEASLTLFSPVQRQLSSFPIFTPPSLLQSLPSISARFFAIVPFSSVSTLLLFNSNHNFPGGNYRASNGQASNPD